MRPVSNFLIMQLSNSREQLNFISFYQKDKQKQDKTEKKCYNPIFDS